MFLRSSSSSSSSPCSPSSLGGLGLLLLRRATPSSLGFINNVRGFATSESNGTEERSRKRRRNGAVSLLPEMEGDLIAFDTTASMTQLIVDDLSRVLRGIALISNSPTRSVASLPFVYGFPRELPPSSPPSSSVSSTSTSTSTSPSTATATATATTPSTNSPLVEGTPSSSLTPPPTYIQHEEQKLPEAAQERSVPSSRAARLWHFSGLAMGMGLGALSEGLKRTVGLSESSPSSSSSVLLSDANVDRLVATLCRMRGAALKIGQVLSIQDSALIPPAVQEAFERVRKGADYMTSRQLESVMREEHGDSWRDKFVEFDEIPFAAASIGQVHRAVVRLPSSIFPSSSSSSSSTSHEDVEIALKVQYPGVRESIDSDINNLLSVLRLTGLMPTGLYIEKVLKSAKEELQLETDYNYESECQKRFQKLIKDDPAFSVPAVLSELSTERTLATSLVRGLPLEKVVSFPESTRNWIAKKLMELCLRELFEFRFMQTDPNWCNFFYDPQERKIHLLDFGASREYPAEFCEEYLELVYAASRGDRDKIISSSIKLGFLTGEENRYMLQAHADAVTIIGEPFAQDEPYDFQGRGMTKRIHQLIPVMLKNRLKPPPSESYSLHRKLSGTFLLCTKLNASISCKDILHRIYHKSKPAPTL